MKVKIALSLFLLSLAAPLMAAADRVEIWGARPVALGGAFVGYSEGPDGPFWNPAGIAGFNARGLSLTYGDANEETGQKEQSEWAVSFVEAAKESRRPFGFFAINNSTSGVASDQTVGLSIAGTPIQGESGFKLLSGINLKYLTTTVKTPQENDRSSFGADLGLMAILNPRFSVGAVVRDLNRPKDTPGSNHKREPTFAFGTRLDLFAGTALLFDAVHVRHNDYVDYRTGLELWLIRDWLALRGGINHNARSMGVGFKTGPRSNFSVNYAYVSPYNTDDTHSQNVVSLNLRWGGPSEEGGEEDLTYTENTDTRKEEESAVGAADDNRYSRKVRDMKRRREFGIGAEDTLQVDVKDHPELETIVKVDSWGFAKFPYIGDLRVEGNTPSQLAKRLEDLYQGFVEEPRVEVTIAEYTSRSIYVLGQVEKPGRYPLGGRQLTVRDAVIMAGLPTIRAATWRVFVVRQTPKGPTYRPINLTKILNRGVLDNNIVLEAEDIVYVPIGFLDAIVTYVGRLVGPLFGIAGAAFAGGSSN